MNCTKLNDIVECPKFNVGSIDHTEDGNTFKSPINLEQELLVLYNEAQSLAFRSADIETQRLTLALKLSVLNDLAVKLSSYYNSSNLAMSSMTNLTALLKSDQTVIPNLVNEQSNVGGVQSEQEGQIDIKTIPVVPNSEDGLQPSDKLEIDQSNNMMELVESVGSLDDKVFISDSNVQVVGDDGDGQSGDGVVGQLESCETSILTKKNKKKNKKQKK